MLTPLNVEDLTADRGGGSNGTGDVDASEDRVECESGGEKGGECVEHVEWFFFGCEIGGLSGWLTEYLLWEIVERV